jgi:hypothetical protein
MPYNFSSPRHGSVSARRLTASLLSRGGLPDRDAGTRSAAFPSTGAKLLISFDPLIHLGCWFTFRATKGVL